MHTYAIIKTGGKEYRVSPGKIVKVERIEAEPGETIEFDEVCMLVNGDQVATGKPLVKGARVRAQVVKHGQEKGTIVFRMKRRRFYQNKFDRQPQFTSLRINEIIFGDDVFGKHQSDPRKIKRTIAAAKTSKSRKAKAPISPKPDRKAQPTLTSLPARGPVARAPATRTTVSKADAPRPETSKTPPRRSQPAVTTPHTLQVKSAEQDKRRWIVTAVILLGLLALIALFWSMGPTPQKSTGPVVGVKTSPEEIRLQQTRPVDRPSAPTQPPE